MITVAVGRRRPDRYGSGEFGAKRDGGSRSHNGVDLVLFVCSGVEGKVTKLGYPYSDDLSYRYVEITNSDTQLRHRYFYVKPCVKVGQEIVVGDRIGTPQSLDKRYPGITEHVHYEVLNSVDEYIDPDTL